MKALVAQSMIASIGVLRVDLVETAADSFLGQSLTIASQKTGIARVKDPVLLADDLPY